MDASECIRSSARVLLKLMPEKSERVVNLIRSVKWKNEVAAKHEAYKPTKIEHFANILTHLAAVPLALWWLYELLQFSSNPNQTTSALIYGAVLIGLFSVSTVFHTFSCIGKHETLRELFHRGDRAMIYLFIAGSYTPWLSLSSFNPNGFASSLRWGIWPLASFGIVYQQLFHEKYKWLETLLYLSIGIVPGLLASMEMYDERGLFELKLGGSLYVIGVVFFKCDGRIPLAHAIWHLFVVAGSSIHYFAVLEYLYGASNTGKQHSQSLVDVEMSTPKLIHSDL